MGLISTSDFELLTDSIAKSWQELSSTVGTISISNTLLYGVNNNLTRIQSYSDPALTAGLITPANNLLTDISVARLLSPRYSAFLRALNVTIDTAIVSGVKYNKDIDAYLTDQSIRCAAEFGDLFYAVFGYYLTTSNVFSREISNMGTLAFTGAGAATFTDGDAIDNTKYADQQLKLVLDDNFTLSATVTLRFENSAGTQENKTITIADGATSGTEYDIGSASDKYFDVVSKISVTGGANGYDCHIYAPRERAATA